MNTYPHNAQQTAFILTIDNSQQQHSPSHTSYQRQFLQQHSFINTSSQDPSTVLINSPHQQHSSTPPPPHRRHLLADLSPARVSDDGWSAAGRSVWKTPTCRVHVSLCPPQILHMSSLAVPPKRPSHERRCGGEDGGDGE